MEETVENLEKQMEKAGEKLDNLALQVGNIESEIFAEEGNQIEVFSLLKSVNEVKNNYQNLRKELSDVQDLQKQVSSSLQVQIRMMQSKFNTLKTLITTNATQKRQTTEVPNLLMDVQHHHHHHHQQQQHHHKYNASSNVELESQYDDGDGEDDDDDDY
ncbi:PREDICTED: rho GTPase-activating protein gacF-like [Nicrophorus vespilloides]|uniref:Rho GTPase-activating protein gacF-like n=1 Tax=Nicrophorus vespilloides TaxID=110193 RepID=A0ABM1NIQ7_NICVS|nr:PREDICTED: rho GTPase-activating protein gacF-like [Nicrophorus vespilloides]XP_017786706.1 PREDICTED: rho GTPase-activating protein gacF-like [Nicrophorus vespilloides]XP_017786707.1 PREDICTED: rho GTPase-activating protein gacF-like [Nicrophorus vespilloides]